MRSIEAVHPITFFKIFFFFSNSVYRILTRWMCKENNGLKKKGDASDCSAPMQRLTALLPQSKNAHVPPVPCVGPMQASSHSPNTCRFGWLAAINWTNGGSGECFYLRVGPGNRPSPRGSWDGLRQPCDPRVQDKESGKRTDYAVEAFHLPCQSTWMGLNDCRRR